ncbi:tetratricopeptide repeat protein [Anderseniella sp. Alg231-50]|uniref:tetratricopeptide repeat protein n=1 Tax=Anderseniella sp. Alg231-50 TaxID=1922226 RepID=UPI000D55BD18
MKFTQLFITGVLALGVTGCSQGFSLQHVADFGASISTSEPRLPGPHPATSDHLQGETGTKHHAGRAPYHPSDNLLQTAKGEFREGRFGLAEKSYRKAVELSPRDVEAWIGLAASYDRLRRFDLADRAYAHAIKLVGHNTMMLNNLGYSQLLRGDLKKARQHFLAAFEREPDNPIIQNNLELLNQSGKRIVREKA